MYRIGAILALVAMISYSIWSTIDGYKEQLKDSQNALAIMTGKRDVLAVQNTNLSLVIDSVKASNVKLTKDIDKVNSEVIKLRSATTAKEAAWKRKSAAERKKHVLDLINKEKVIRAEYADINYSTANCQQGLELNNIIGGLNFDDL